MHQPINQCVSLFANTNAFSCVHACALTGVAPAHIRSSGSSRAQHPLLEQQALQMQAQVLVLQQRQQQVQVPTQQAVLAQLQAQLEQLQAPLGHLWVLVIQEQAPAQQELAQLQAQLEQTQAKLFPQLLVTLRAWMWRTLGRLLRRGMAQQ